VNAWSWAGIATTAGGAGLVIWAVWKVAWHEAGGWHGHRHCTCTHPRQAHLHYRRGRDCGLCPCRKYKPIDWDGWLQKLTKPAGSNG
jgi:hypothetical protein